MPRLIDHILTNGLFPPFWVDNTPALRNWRTGTDMILPLFREAEVFVVDNVCEYLFAGTDQEHWNFSDFPNLAPPFDTFWVEMKRPSKVVSEEHGVISSAAMPEHWGILFQAGELPDTFTPVERVQAVESLRQYVRTQWEYYGAGIRAKETEYGESYTDHLTKTERKVLEAQAALVAADRGNDRMLTRPEGVRWSMVGRLFMEIDKGKACGPLGEWHGLITEQGQLHGEPDWGGMIPEGAMPPPAQFFTSLTAYTYPAFLGISFLHCRNVKVARTDPPAKLSRAYQKRHGGHPLTRFHTLEIQPMRQILERTGQAHGTDLRMSLHICRGHFKTFDEKPLFGKHRGTYWWNPMVRGSAKEGVVAKDYAVGTGG